MSKISSRMPLALLVGAISVLISRSDFSGSGGVVSAQTSATSPTNQASPAGQPAMAPHRYVPPGPGYLWVKGHPLTMPYRRCADLIERRIWGQQATITDAACKAKLEEALRINRTEPDVDAVPAINGSRPEDLSPPGTQPFPQRSEPTQ